MFKLLLLLFILIPLAEIYVLILVGGGIGALPTVSLCILTAALGTLLLRAQGIQTLKRVQDKIDRGELPATDVIEAFILLISGMLLLTPGFITDIIGFFCLVPGPRTRIATAILIWLIKQRHIHTSAVQQTDIIEGEFREETDEAINKITHTGKD